MPPKTKTRTNKNGPQANQDFYHIQAAIQKLTTNIVLLNDKVDHLTNCIQDLQDDVRKSSEENQRLKKVINNQTPVEQSKNTITLISDHCIDQPTYERKNKGTGKIDVIKQQYSINLFIWLIQEYRTRNNLLPIPDGRARSQARHGMTLYKPILHRFKLKKNITSDIGWSDRRVKPYHRCLKDQVEKAVNQYIPIGACTAFWGARIMLQKNWNLIQVDAELTEKTAKDGKNNSYNNDNGHNRENSTTSSSGHDVSEDDGEYYEHDESDEDDHNDYDNNNNSNNNYDYNNDNDNDEDDDEDDSNYDDGDNDNDDNNDDDDNNNHNDDDDNDDNDDDDDDDDDEGEDGADDCILLSPKRKGNTGPSPKNKRKINDTISTRIMSKITSINEKRRRDYDDININNNITNDSRNKRVRGKKQKSSTTKKMTTSSNVNN